MQSVGDALKCHYGPSYFSFCLPRHDLNPIELLKDSKTVKEETVSEYRGACDWFQPMGSVCGLIFYPPWSKVIGSSCSSPLSLKMLESLKPIPYDERFLCIVKHLLQQ